MVDIDKVLQNKDQLRIKELEKELTRNQEYIQQLDEAKSQYDKQVQKFEKERSEKEELRIKLNEMLNMVNFEKSRANDLRVQLNKVMKEFLAQSSKGKGSNNEKLATKSQMEMDKNKEVFDLEKRKLKKDLKDTKEIVVEQKSIIKRLKDERAQHNIQIEQLRQQFESGFVLVDDLQSTNKVEKSNLEDS